MSFKSSVSGLQAQALPRRSEYAAMFHQLGNLRAGVRIAILDDYQNVALTCAEQVWTHIRTRNKVSIEIEVFTKPIPTEELAATLKDFDIICTMRERTPFTAELFAALPRLKLLNTTGPVNRSIDLDAAERRGVIVAGTGAIGNSTVEHIWGLLLAVARNIPAYDRGIRQRGSPWQSLDGKASQVLPTGLMGKTLGVVGFGRLGAAVAKIANAFGMKVIAWSPNLTPEKLTLEEHAYVKIVSKKELFETADFVSVHLVLSERSVGIIGKEELFQMKPEAFLINTSRGPIINEDALLYCLRTGRIKGAGLDVFDKEPLPEDSPWKHMTDRVVLTPHVGYVEQRNYEKFWQDTVWNIDVWLDGKEEYAFRLA